MIECNELTLRELAKRLFDAHGVQAYQGRADSIPAVRVSQSACHSCKSLWFTDKVSVTAILWCFFVFFHGASQLVWRQNSDLGIYRQQYDISISFLLHKIPFYLHIFTTPVFGSLAMLLLIPLPPSCGGRVSDRATATWKFR